MLNSEVRPRDWKRLWSRRRVLFPDIASDRALWHAIDEALSCPGEGNEWVDEDSGRAVAEFVYDPSSDYSLGSPTRVSDKQLERVGASREDLEYWVARERIAAVGFGARVDGVVPRLTRPAVPRRRGAARCAPRPRTRRRRVARTARAPDDPSRPRPDRRAAPARPGWPA